MDYERAMFGMKISDARAMEAGLLFPWGWELPRFQFFFFKHGSFWKVHGTMGRNRDQENIPDFINWGVSLYPLGVWNWKTNTIDSSVHVITVS